MLTKKIRYLATAIVLALFTLTPTLTTAPVYAQVPAVVPLTSSKCPDCWAGYGDNGAPSSVTMVTASIIQQAVTCNPASGLSQAVSDMVGLDGTSGSADFLLVATAAICLQGSSTPVYEMLDTGPGGTIRGATIRPGDEITMTVYVFNGSVHFRFKDVTSGTSGRDRESAKGFTLQSATCATEMFGGFALAQFTKALFTNCDATIGGTTLAIGAFGSAATLVKYRCVNIAETTTLARAFVLSSSDFRVSWFAAGP